MSQNKEKKIAMQCTHEIYHYMSDRIGGGNIYTTQTINDVGVNNEGLLIHLVSFPFNVFSDTDQSNLPNWVNSKSSYAFVIIQHVKIECFFESNSYNEGKSYVRSTNLETQKLISQKEYSNNSIANIVAVPLREFSVEIIKDYFLNKPIKSELTYSIPEHFKIGVFIMLDVISFIESNQAKNDNKSFINLGGKKFISSHEKQNNTSVQIQHRKNDFIASIDTKPSWLNSEYQAFLIEIGNGTISAYFDGKIDGESNVYCRVTSGVNNGEVTEKFDQKIGNLRAFLNSFIVSACDELIADANGNKKQNRSKPQPINKNKSGSKSAKEKITKNHSNIQTGERKMNTKAVTLGLLIILVIWDVLTTYYGTYQIFTLGGKSNTDNNIIHFVSGLFAVAIIVFILSYRTIFRANNGV
ncbi:MAG: hypothetical protein HRT73_15525, partial [Flavobacteriales bacterium]|nr:hypothetical protein [Flavobacteriales bacterium]